jgi:hypothetical protein
MATCRGAAKPSPATVDGGAASLLDRAGSLKPS